ncbi:hypothetical protein RMSM_02626 [Rhodopirellula maiorica SM1]|uniref:Uncharacterized protein n=1 Tax=Rhodopirellula maiorica SM1 TaxID=1265738 RepID=M5RMN1_9BACT|nr:hypothetical protein [Rhodopirellula maiorica]EMI20451.1 hypothetical protein RMSM_02626 [Rhodopirellula maiorica SM1]
MGILETLFGQPNEIVESKNGEGWNKHGFGTKYMLITTCDSQPVARLYGTARDSRRELLTEIDALLCNQEKCLLIGVEAGDGVSRFFRLDPNEARERLGA